MNIKQTTQYFRMTAVLALTVFSASFNVQAGKPDAYTNEYAAPGDIVDCGAYVITDDAYVIENIKDFYNKDGVFIRSDIQFSATDDIYRLDDPDGAHLNGTAHMMGRVSFDENGDMLWTQSGVAVAIMVPEYGRIFLDAGRLVYNMDNGWELLFSAGKNHDWNFADFQALCEYFE